MSAVDVSTCTPNLLVDINGFQGVAQSRRGPQLRPYLLMGS